MDVTDFCKEQYAPFFGKLLFPDFMEKLQKNEDRPVPKPSENGFVLQNLCDSIVARPGNKINEHLEQLPPKVLQQILQSSTITHHDVAAFSAACSYAFFVSNKNNNAFWQRKFQQTFQRLSGRATTFQKLSVSGVLWYDLFRSRIKIEQKCFKFISELADELWHRKGVLSIDWSHLRKLARRVSKYAEWPLLLEDALFAITCAAAHAARHETSSPAEPLDIRTRNFAWIRQHVFVHYYARPVYDEVVRAFMRPLLYETIAGPSKSLDLFKTLHISSHYLEPSYFLIGGIESVYSRACAEAIELARRVAENYSAHKVLTRGQSWRATPLAVDARWSNVPADEIVNILAVLNDVLFAEEKYQCTNDIRGRDYRQKFEVVSILHLVKTKKFLPSIVICALYKHIAAQLGILLESMGTAVHFWLCYTVKDNMPTAGIVDVNELMFVDPVNGGAVTRGNTDSFRLIGGGEKLEDWNLFEFRTPFPNYAPLRCNLTSVHKLMKHLKKEIDKLVDKNKSYCRSLIFPIEQAAADIDYIGELIVHRFGDTNITPAENIIKAASDMIKVHESAQKNTAESFLFSIIQQKVFDQKASPETTPEAATAEEDWYSKAYAQAERATSKKSSSIRSKRDEEKGGEEPEVAAKAVQLADDAMDVDNHDEERRTTSEEVVSAVLKPSRYKILISKGSGWRHVEDDDVVPLIQAKPDVVDSKGNIRRGANPLLGQYFKRFNGRFYEALDSLAKIYADDESKCRQLYDDIMASNSSKTNTAAEKEQSPSDAVMDVENNH